MIYISSPFTHSDKEVERKRYEAAMSYQAFLLQNNYFPISPIVSCYPLSLAHSLPTTATFWWPYNKQLLLTCNELHVLMIDGWSQSKGVIQEIAYFTGRLKYIINSPQQNYPENT